MDTPDELDTILTRRSIRKFSPRPVNSDLQKTLLRAAFAAPSAEDAQTKRIIVVTDRDTLDSLAVLHHSAGPAREAPLAFLICCDTSVTPQTIFWPQDCAAATQNVMLAARALGLGSLWCGIHPEDTREQAFMAAFDLPGMVRPVSLVIIGYPLQDFFDEERWEPKFVCQNRSGHPFEPVSLPAD